MVKLRFDKLSLVPFNSFKLIPKKRKVNINCDKKVTNKLIKGICVIENNEYKIKLNVRELKPKIIDKNQPDILVIPFTEDSYDIKGQVSVFDRNPDKYGRYTRYIRDIVKAKFHPGDPERYVPFCKNRICDGYIIKKYGNLYFKFNECIAPEGYDTFISEETE